MPLCDLIIDRITTDGPISFHDFMEMCLYYPELGYYTSTRDKLGKNGDYYTSSFLTQAFGAMIGRQLEEMWAILGEEEFTIVEYGAGTGLLSHDVLNYLRRNAKFYDRLKYCIIEKSAAMTETAKLFLAGEEKVEWHNSIDEIHDITGCILSNELINNFAVHQVVMEEELMEVFVDYDNGFKEILLPARRQLTDYLDELNIALPRGFRTEINLQAHDWIREIGTSLARGYVITIDYGYNSKELYASFRNGGTLICYNKHSVNEHFYQDIGCQDITSHVNFSALCHWGIKNDLLFCGYTNQAHFLLSLGITDYLKQSIEKEPDNYINYKKEAFLKRTLLVDMGSKFKVLLQRKGIEQQGLMGLRLNNQALHPAKMDLSLVA